MEKASQKGIPKKNKGGRPRKHAKAGSTAITWKKLSQPVSSHTYEVSSQGQVRRLKADGTYYDIKPWLNSGNAYLSVYIYGVAGATRNRKKVYVHKLVAQEFVAGRSKGKVVHHTIGPQSNTKSTLQWVTPSENLKARKFFNDDGTRKKRKPKTARLRKKVKVPAQRVSDAERSLKVNQKLDTQPPEKKVLPKPVNIKQQPAPKKQEKQKVAAIVPAKVVKKRIKRMPNEADKRDKSWNWIWTRKLNWLKKNRPAFMKTWSRFRKANRLVTAKNLNVVYKLVTKKKLEKEVANSPAAQWDTKFRRAMKVITDYYK